MTIDSIIRTAVTPIVTECEPNRYDGAATEYCVFNYTERGDAWGDDTASAVIYSVQLHYYLPHGINPNVKKKQLRAALVAAGATFPSIINASDDTGQHYTFECDFEGGAG